MMKTIIAFALVSLTTAAPSELARKPLFSSHHDICTAPAGCDAPIDTLAHTIQAIIGAATSLNIVCLTYYATCGIIGPKAVVECILDAVAELPQTGIIKFLRNLRRCLVGSNEIVGDPICTKPDGCDAPIDTLADTIQAIIGAAVPPNVVCLTYYSTCGVVGPGGPVECILDAVAKLVANPVLGIPAFLRSLSGCLVGTSFAMPPHDPETGQPMMLGR